MEVKVAASILSADLGSLNEEIQDVTNAGAEMIHFDVMDGHFVPNVTFGAPLMKNIKTNLPMDIHLMIENPQDFIEDFAKSLPGGRQPNGDVIAVHVEACPHLHRVIQLIKSFGFRTCVALNPATPLTAIEEVVDELDQVLVMTVNPGYSGQKFIASALGKVRELRSHFPELDIEVDGGIDNVTCRQAVEAGANVLVSASYLFGSEDRAEAVRLLKS